MNGTLDPRLLQTMIPTLGVGMEDMSVSVAQSCGSKALASVGTSANRAVVYDDAGFDTSSFGRGAPVCTTPVEDLSSVSVIVEKIEIEVDRLSVKPGTSGFVQILPMCGKELRQSGVERFSREGFKVSVNSCTASGISTYRFSLEDSSDWFSVFANESPVPVSYTHLTLPTIPLV